MNGWFLDLIQRANGNGGAFGLHEMSSLYKLNNWWRGSYIQGVPKREVPFFWVRKWPLLPKVPIFETKKWHFEWPNQNSKTTFIVQTFPKYGPYDFYLVNLSLLSAILAIFQFCLFLGLFWQFFNIKNGKYKMPKKNRRWHQIKNARKQTHVKIQCYLGIHVTKEKRIILLYLQCPIG